MFPPIIIIEIDLYLKDLEQKISWHVFLWRGVYIQSFAQCIKYLLTEYDREIQLTYILFKSRYK